MTSVREKLIKISAKVIGHARYVVFQITEVAIQLNLFTDILRLIANLRPPPRRINGVSGVGVMDLAETDRRPASR